MQTLYVLRHAKSSWGDASLADHDRPLAPRGVKAAKNIAAHLKRLGVAPDLVLCSPACRTRETLQAVLGSLGGDPHVQFEASLYGAEAGELIDRLRSVPASSRSVMVIAHNPGLEDLVAALAGTASAETAVAKLRAKFPTGALATIDLGEQEWAQLAPGSGKLVSLVYPRDLE